MPVAVIVNDSTVHERMLAIDPSVDIDTGVWQIGDTTDPGDPVATGRLQVAEGFTADLELSLVRADTSVGDSQVKISYQHRDEDDNVLSDGATASFTVNSTEATHSLPIPAAPAGTVACDVSLISDMAATGEPVRINQHPDPRCTSAGIWSARNSWTREAVTGLTGTPLGTLTTAVQARCTSAGSATNSGLNLYCAVGESSPSGAGAPAVPGSTMTFSVMVLTTKAGTITLEVRPFAGTTWSASATSSATSVPANTWTRVSVTLTVPAGATQLAATIRQSTTIWAVGDKIMITGILNEEAASMLPYFDGAGMSGSIPAPKSSRWESGADASRSLLYAATRPGGTTVQATGSTLTYAALAEELLGVALERDLRRSVADIWNDPQALITAGTPALLSGRFTFLCTTLADALALDSVYQLPGLATLEDSGSDLDGLEHRAVGRTRITAERALPGVAARWTVEVEFREQGSV